MKNKKPLLYSIVAAIAKVIFTVAIPMKVKGKENIPEGKFVLCSNHLTWADPVLLGITNKRQVCFMGKAELFKNKIIAAFLRGLGAFPVNRGTSDRGALEAANDVLENGKILGIFIEGTRSKTGELLKPKPGAVMLAYGAKAPILPVCITPKGGGQIKLFKAVKVTYGKPIYPDELNIEEGKSSEIRNATRFVMEKITQIRENDLL